MLIRTLDYIITYIQTGINVFKTSYNSYVAVFKKDITVHL